MDIENLHSQLPTSLGIGIEVWSLVNELLVFFVHTYPSIFPLQSDSDSKELSSGIQALYGTVKNIRFLIAISD